MAVVSVTATGDPIYGFAARQAILSVLDHTDFRVVAHCDPSCGALLPRSDRVTTIEVSPRFVHRADPFLGKFDAWRATLDHCDDEVILHLDADAVLCRPLGDDDLRHALGGGQFAMVEQPGIIGSSMDRPAFLEHYLAHSHAYIAPLLPAPTLEEFRFFNSGVIIFRRLELCNLVDWADALLADLPDHHRVGEHMIADQDYLQVWANVLRPEARTELDAVWNHCPLWDDDFPRSDARIVHLSNFCNGPPVRTALALQQHRRGSIDTEPDLEWSRLAFCLVTHDSSGTIGDCLAALAAFEGAEVVVVDNASTDATCDFLIRHGVEPIVNRENEGFASAANRAAAATDRPILCFVNPDAFVDLQALRGAIDRVETDPGTALVPDFVHADGRLECGLQGGYTRMKVVLDLLRTGRDPRTPRWFEDLIDIDDADWVWPIAACLVIHRSTFEAVGGFDQSYFVYMEDVAFGLALHRHGFSVDSMGPTVLHLGAQGSGMERVERDRLLDEARIGFASKEYGRVFGRGLAGSARVRRILRRWRR